MAAQRDYLITVSGVPGYFQTITGGSKTSETTMDFDGGSKEPEVLTAPAVIENVTVGRTYKPERDAEFVKRVRDRVGITPKTITVHDVDADKQVIGINRQYDGIIVGFTEPAADVNAGDRSRFEITFAVSRVY